MKHILKFFITITAVIVVGCVKQTVDGPPHPEPKAPENVAIDLARQIVSNPSNWKSNTVLITELGGLAEDMQIASTPEFKKFDIAALNLVRFGTTWISSLDEGSREHLGAELSKLTSKTEAVIDIPMSSQGPTGVEIDTKDDLERVSADAERIMWTTVHSLRASQADEFGRLFAEAQSAYRALRRILQERLVKKAGASTTD